MNFGAVLLLALGLAMDATAAAAARGLAAPAVRVRQVALVAGLFGGAQGVMPWLGWMVGDRVGPLVAAWDHWIVFVVLVALGAKMLWEAWGGGARATATVGDAFALPVLLALTLATSLDAFAAGITLPMVQAPLMLSVITIGVTTALLSAAGVLLGRRFGQRLGGRLDAFGGLVLILLGAKTLLEHLLAGAG